MMNPENPATVRTRLQILALRLMLLALISVIAVMALVPPVSRDALTQHLAVPRLYLMHGGLFELPHIPASYNPMNLDLLYLIPLYAGNDILPKYIHFAFALLTAWLLYRYLKKRIDATYALLGVLFFLSLPVIVRLSSVVYVDLGLIFFSFAALLYLLQWVENGFALRHLALSGIFCGLALGTKYNGLITLFILTALAVFLYARFHPETRASAIRSMRAGAVFVIIALLLFSPWMIRNCLWTGNPIYPLYDGIISPGPPAPPDSGDLSSHFLRHRKILFNESWAEIALIPIRIFFQGKDDSPQYFDGRLNPFLFILPFFAFLPTRQENRFLRTDKSVFLVYAVLTILIVFFQKNTIIRHLSPALPPLVILAVFGLHRLNILFSRVLPDNRTGAVIRRGIITGLIITALAMNVFYIVERFRHVAPFTFITGAISRDEYIRKYRPEYSAMQYANRNLSDRDRILAIYLGARRYYCDIDIVFDLNLLKDLAATTQKAEGVADALTERGITHLLINMDLFSHYAAYYPLPEKQIVRDFLINHTTRLYTGDGHCLFTIKDPPADGSTSPAQEAGVTE